MYGSCSHALSYRPPPAPSLSRVRVSLPVRLSPFSRDVRSCDSLRRSPIRKWRISCFRREEISSENLKPEAIEDVLADELVRPKLDATRAVEKSWTVNVGEVELHKVGISQGLSSASLARGLVGYNLLVSRDRGMAVGSIIRATATPWSVPWSGETILQVMLLWVASFWFIGSWMMPFMAHFAGYNKDSLTYRGQALYSLLTDATEGLAGIAILFRYLSKFRPFPTGWFSFSLKGNWHIDVALGCLMFPLVNQLSQVNVDLLPLFPSTPVILSSVEQSILARDPIAMALYAIVVSLCAPVWEEIVFRGFLLPSLTRYMPVWCSIVVSSVVFALAHFNVQRMLPLVLLGVVMGVVFARSRNLLASMVLHSLWNGFVFLDLMR